MRAYLWLEGNYYYYLHRDEITAKAMEQVNCRVDGVWWIFPDSGIVLGNRFHLAVKSEHGSGEDMNKCVVLILIGAKLGTKM